MTTTSSTKNDAKSKGKQPVRNQKRAELATPKNSVFSMHGQDILEDDPTYIGGTHVTPVRAVARPDTGKVKDVRSTTAFEGEETREGMRLLFCIMWTVMSRRFEVAHSLTAIV